MERHEIEIFLALAEELHFARTAERLRVSASSVSQTIGMLERRFGAPLFARTTRRVELTELGRQLHADLAPAYGQVLAAIDRACDSARASATRLTVGYMSTAVSRRLISLAERFATGRVQITEVSLGDMFGPLRRGEVDLLLVPLPVHEPDLTVGPVAFSEPTMLGVRSDHRLATRRSVSLGDISGERILLAAGLPEYWTQQHHAPAGDALPPDRVELPGFQEILAYVTAGRGVAIVGEQVQRYYPRPGLTCVPIEGDRSFDYAFVARTHHRRRVTDRFIAHVKTELASH